MSFQIYRCNECGYVTDAEKPGAIGTAHAHAEKHTGFWSFGNARKLDEYIDLIEVKEYEQIPTETGFTEVFDRLLKFKERVIG